MLKRVLVVEDDEAIARLLSANLVREGFQVARAGTATEARSQLEDFRPELVLLDLMLPEGDGFQLCEAIASRRDHPPVIVLSARNSGTDKIRGLDLGADDYVTKPFALDELLARIRAVLRRHDSAVGELQLGDVVIDFRARRATRNGCELGLSNKEIDMIQYLADRPGKLVTRDDLLHEVWGYKEAPLTRAVDISIARLRRKIERHPHKPRFIRTLHGGGYSLTPEG